MGPSSNVQSSTYTPYNNYKTIDSKNIPNYAQSTVITPNNTTTNQNYNKTYTNSNQYNTANTNPYKSIVIPYTQHDRMSNTTSNDTTTPKVNQKINYNSNVTVAHDRKPSGNYMDSLENTFKNVQDNKKNVSASEKTANYLKNTDFVESTYGGFGEKNLMSPINPPKSEDAAIDNIVKKYVMEEDKK